MYRQDMQDIVIAIILGIIEGLTEFIPVSSTGHLILAGHTLQFQGSENGTFEVAIQLGAIAAVIWLYWDFFRGYLNPKTWFNRDSRIVLVAILPALILGFFLHSQIKAMFSPTIVGISLGIGGMIMILVEKLLKPKAKTHSIHHLTYRQALIVGLCQCAALIPGMSRSGSTIVGGLVAKLDYPTSARFSFIIAVPVMVAAVGYDLLQTADRLSPYEWGLIGIGFVVSFFVAIAAVMTFMKVLSKLKLTPFAIYRLLLSLIILAFYF